jgi:hypothetical protein
MTEELKNLSSIEVDAVGRAALPHLLEYFNSAEALDKEKAEKVDAGMAMLRIANSRMSNETRRAAEAAKIAKTAGLGLKSIRRAIAPIVDLGEDASGPTARKGGSK